MKQTKYNVLLDRIISEGLSYGVDTSNTNPSKPIHKSKFLDYIINFYGFSSIRYIKKV